jgi:hypothetical protein
MLLSTAAYLRSDSESSPSPPSYYVFFHHSASSGFFFLIHRSHSISFTRAQGIPKYKIRFGREKDGKVGERIADVALVRKSC